MRGQILKRKAMLIMKLKNIIQKAISCILVLLTVLMSPCVAFAVPTRRLVLYQEEFTEAEMKDVARSMAWHLDYADVTTWRGKDGEMHSRTAGSEQEHFDDFWEWQQDYLKSYPVEEAEEIRKNNKNAKIDDEAYDGINYFDKKTGRRVFWWLRDTTENWYDDFNISLSDMGIDPSSDFYANFYGGKRYGSSGDHHFYGTPSSGGFIWHSDKRTNVNELYNWFKENTSWSDAEILAIIVNMWCESRFWLGIQAMDSNNAYSGHLVMWNETGRAQLLMGTHHDKAAQQQWWDYCMEHLGYIPTAEETYDDLNVQLHFVKFEIDEWHEYQEYGTHPVNSWFEDKGYNGQSLDDLALVDLQDAVFAIACRYECCADPGARMTYTDVIEGVANIIRYENGEYVSPAELADAQSIMSGRLWEAPGTDAIEAYNIGALDNPLTNGQMGVTTKPPKNMVE